MESALVQENTNADFSSKKSLHNSAISGIRWSFISQFARQGLSFVFTAVLARLLSPQDYGLMGMATVAIGFIQTFKDLGTSAAIIQRQNPSELLLSSIFWVNLGVGCLIMGMVMIISPLVSIFYHDSRLTLILDVLSLSFVLSGSNILHNALMEKHLCFDVLARIELSSAFIGGIAGVGSAVLGFGVWSLVFQSITNDIVTTIYLWFASKWRPSILISKQEIKSVYSYSINLTGYNVFNYFARNADYIIIGRYLGATALGYYTLAYRLMLLPLQSTTYVIGRVLFPAFSLIQDDNARFRSIYLRVCYVISLITFPMMTGLWIISEPFIVTIIGSKWSPVIILIKILTPLGMVQSILATTGTIYQVKGKTDWLFYWGVASGTFVTLCFVIGLRWGTSGVACMYLVAYLFLTYPCVAIPFKLIGLKVRMLLVVLWRPFICSLFMFLVLLGVRTFVYNKAPIFQLLVIVPIGIVVYIYMLWITSKAQLIQLKESLMSK